MQKLGLDFNWNSFLGGNPQLYPTFERKVLEEHPDGSLTVRDEQGLIVLYEQGLFDVLL